MRSGWGLSRPPSGKMTPKKVFVTTLHSRACIGMAMNGSQRTALAGTTCSFSRRFPIKHIPGFTSRARKNRRTKANLPNGSNASLHLLDTEVFPTVYHGFGSVPPNSLNFIFTTCGGVFQYSYSGKPISAKHTAPASLATAASATSDPNWLDA